MVLFCQQTIIDPFYFLPFDLNNHSQFHFWDIVSCWCCSSVAIGGYLDFVISSRLDLLSLSSLLLSTFQCRFLITVVTKSRECPDYKKFMLEILKISSCLLPGHPAWTTCLFSCLCLFPCLHQSPLKLCQFLLALSISSCFVTTTLQSHITDSYHPWQQTTMDLLTIALVCHHKPFPTNSPTYRTPGTSLLT